MKTLIDILNEAVELQRYRKLKKRYHRSYPYDPYLDTPKVNDQTQNYIHEVFVVVKPGFLDKSTDIIEMFKREGFEFVQMRTKQLQFSEAQRLYYKHREEEYYTKLCKFMISGPCLGIMFDYHKSIDSKKLFSKVDALKDKVRERFGEDELRNCLHSSDNPENMDKESRIFF